MDKLGRSCQVILVNIVSSCGKNLMTDKDNDWFSRT